MYCIRCMPQISVLPSSSRTLFVLVSPPRAGGVQIFWILGRVKEIPPHSSEAWGLKSQLWNPTDSVIALPKVSLHSDLSRKFPLTRNLTEL